jgi:hypothetical protein
MAVVTVVASVLRLERARGLLGLPIGDGGAWKHACGAVLLHDCRVKNNDCRVHHAAGNCRSGDWGGWHQQ